MGPNETAVWEWGISENPFCGVVRVYDILLQNLCSFEGKCGSFVNSESLPMAPSVCKTQMSLLMQFCKMQEDAGRISIIKLLTCNKNASSFRDRARMWRK